MCCLNAAIERAVPRTSTAAIAAASGPPGAYASETRKSRCHCSRFLAIVGSLPTSTWITSVRIPR